MYVIIFTNTLTFAYIYITIYYDFNNIILYITLYYDNPVILCHIVILCIYILNLYDIFILLHDRFFPSI